MPYYELVTILNGRLKRDELVKCLMDASKIVLKTGGIVTRIDALGANGTGPRRLSSHIRKYQVSYYHGYYAQIGLVANESMCKEMRRNFGLDTRILRYKFQRTSIMNCMRPVIDLDAPLPSQEPDRSDPVHELKSFMQKYEKEFPSGESIDISLRLRKAHDLDLQPILRTIDLSNPYRSGGGGGGSSKAAPSSPMKDMASKYLKMLNVDPPSEEGRTGEAEGRTGKVAGQKEEAGPAKEEVDPVALNNPFREDHESTESSSTTTEQQETSAATEQQGTSAATEQQGTSAATEQQETLAATEQQETSAATEQQETSAATEQQETSAATEQQETSAATKQQGTSAATDQPETSTTSTVPAAETTTMETKETDRGDNNTEGQKEDDDDGDRDRSEKDSDDDNLKPTTDKPRKQD